MPSNRARLQQSNIMDITYIDQGLFTAFIPQTKDGEEVFREICRVQGDNTGKVLTIHAKQTISQIRKAGYKVRKSKKVSPMSADDLDRLLDDLSS